MWVLKLHDYFKHSFPLADFPRYIFQCLIFSSLFFNVRCSFWLIFFVGFSNIVFLDALFIAIGFQLNKSPLDFLTPDGAGRAHNFPMSNWQCDRSKRNNFKSGLPVSNLLLLDYVIENGVINYPLSMASRFIFISWFFKHRLLSRSTCWCPSFRCRINGRLMFKILCWSLFFITLRWLFIFNQSSKQYSL